MRKLFPLSLSIAVSLLSACGTPVPSVQYEKVVSGPPDLQGLVKFNLPKTILMFDYADPTTKESVVLKAVPAESEANLFQIRPSDPWLRKSTFKWTKRDNTNLLESVGSDVDDERVKTIETVGSTLAALIPLTSSLLLKQKFPDPFAQEPQPEATPPQGLKLPLAIDTEPFLSSYAVPGKPISDATSDGTDATKGGRVGFNISFGELSADAIELKKYFDLTQGRNQNALFTSACRTMTITFTTGPLKDKKYTAMIADPHYIQTVAYPAKGVIKMHTVCGADVLSDSATASTSAEVVNAVIAQAKSLSETWKTAKDKAEADKKAKDAAKGG